MHVVKLLLKFMKKKQIDVSSENIGWFGGIWFDTYSITKCLRYLRPSYYRIDFVGVNESNGEALAHHVPGLLKHRIFTDFNKLSHTDQVVLKIVAVYG